MIIPSEVNILGLKYQVKIVQNLKEVIMPYLSEKEKNEDYLGYFVNENLTIFLDGCQTRQILEHTLLHEIVEALDCHLATKLKHDTIERLGSGLYQVLQENNLLEKE